MTTNGRRCFCAGVYQPATVTLTVHDFLLCVPGHRCDTCGEEVIDAHISEAITPAMIQDLRRTIAQRSTVTPLTTTHGPAMSWGRAWGTPQMLALAP